MQRHDYAGPEDLLAMQRAVQRTWTPKQRWHVGDLAWGRYAIPSQEPNWRTALWRDGSAEVRAWGWAELPGHLDLHVDPAYPELASDVVEWFEAVVNGSERSVTVLETEYHLVVALERAGYRSVTEAPFFQHCLIDLDGPLTAQWKPEGYRGRAVGEDEAGARAALHRTAWRPSRIGKLFVPPVNFDDTESQVTTESYQGVMGAWPYRLDLDQIIEAPDGTLAAFALGWLDEINQVGELEPVGTDPGHARKGLGSAVSRACMEALRNAGATRAVVYPRGDSAYPVARRSLLWTGFPACRTDRYLQSLIKRRRWALPSMLTIDRARAGS